jgi:hypothetical protein
MQTNNFPFAKSIAPVLIAAVVFGGCSTPVPPSAIATVGPAAEYGGPQAGQGRLVVFSAYEVSWVGDPDFVHHTRYAICDADGKLIRRVVNFYSDFDPSPVTAIVPAGHYIIKARAAKYGMISIPVVIAASLTTALYLDGVPHDETRGLDPKKSVTLPKGEIVGWRARE